MNFYAPLRGEDFTSPLIRGCVLNIAEQVPSSEGDCSTSQCRHAQVVSALLSHPAAEGAVLAVFDLGEQVEGDVFERGVPKPGVSLWTTVPPDSCPIFL